MVELGLGMAGEERREGDWRELGDMHAVEDFAEGRVDGVRRSQGALGSVVLHVVILLQIDRFVCRRHSVDRKIGKGTVAIYIQWLLDHS